MSNTDQQQQIIQPLTEHALDFWVQLTRDKIYFHTRLVPFKMVNTIVWRGIEFHLRTKSWLCKFGKQSETTLLYNNKRFIWGFATYKWSGGSYGDNPPEIRTTTHILEINRIDHSFTDMALNPDENEEQENPFIIMKPAHEYPFDEPQVPKEPEPNKPTPNNPNEVLLYEYSDTSVNINSYAKFENGELIVDYWKLGNSYEDEEYITIKSEHLFNLYDNFKLEYTNSEGLLQCILKTFRGEDCFAKFETFLKSKHIPFQFQRG
jgi:hypothetical protein